MSQKEQVLLGLSGSAFTWKTESAGGTLALYLAAAILGGLCFRFS